MIYKDEACPELSVLQQIQGPMGDAVLIRQSHKLIKDHTLGEGEGTRQRLVC